MDTEVNEVSEAAAIGDTVGITVFAEDVDIDDSVSYALTVDANGLFRIDESSGVVSVNSILDFESETFHEISALAISSDGSSNSMDFLVSVLDSDAPALSLSFPSPIGLYTASTITVRGHYDDAQSLSIEVEGGAAPVTATLNAADKSWSAENVGLVLDVNNIATITVLGTNNGGESTNIISTLLSAPVLTDVGAFTLDANNGRLLLIDRQASKIVSMRISDGFVAFFGDDTIISPAALALDSANSRLIVVDDALDTVFAVDLDDQSKSTLSQANVNEDLAFSSPESAALVGSSLLVSDSAKQVLFSINLNDGSRARLSENANGSSVDFSVPQAVAYDSANDRVVLSDTGIPAVLEVNLLNGERSLLSGASHFGPAFLSPEHLLLDSSGDLAIVSDEEAEAVFIVNLATGERALLADATTGSGFPFISSGPLIAGPLVNTLSYIDNRLDSIVTLNLLTLERSASPLNNFSGSGVPAYNPTSLTFDEIGQVLMISTEDELYGNSEAGSLFIASGLSGARFRVSTLSQGIAFSHPAAVEFHRSEGATNLYSVGDFGVLDINLIGSDTYTIISRADENIGDGPAINTPSDMALDTLADQLLVISEAGNTLYGVELADGDRQVLASASEGSGSDFISPVAVTYREQDNSALITHSSGELTVLHLNSLVREIISRSVGSGNGIDVNEVAMQAVVADASAQALLAISLEPATLGDSELISAANNGSGITFASPSDVYVNEERQTAYVSDSQLNAIFLVDLTNGNRILLSK